MVDRSTVEWRLAAGAFDFEIMKASVQHVAQKGRRLRRAAVDAHAKVPSIARSQVGNLPSLFRALIGRTDCRSFEIEPMGHIKARSSALSK
jgi:hypothetical protein